LIPSRSGICQNIFAERTKYRGDTIEDGSYFYSAMYRARANRVQGADSNYYQTNVPPPLHLAAMSGNGDIVRLLLAANANLHAVDFGIHDE
jgi:ankyrin repeat protein